MDASQYDLYPLFPIGVGDSVGPQGCGTEDGYANEIDVLEIPPGVNGVDQIIGKGDFGLREGEGSNEGQREVGNASIFLRGWGDEFQFQRLTPGNVDLIS